MGRPAIGNLLRIGGYFLSMVGLLVLFLPGQQDDPDTHQALALVGCFAGLALVVAGVFMRYWPESEASIRKRVEREQALRMKEFSPRGTRGSTGGNTSDKKTSSDQQP
ncbi:MAG: hypothetical protein HUU29_01650 [Planctomycetaceae bacterium]|nr:hypothetical protein [Planctomycetaceae bacterium]